MADEPRPTTVQIATHFATLARRFDIDLTEIVDEGLRERILRDAVALLTARMQGILLAAHADAIRRGHRHIGTEHVFLAILKDEAALPSQLLREAMSLNDSIKRVETLLGSEGYNRNI